MLRRLVMSLMLEMTQAVWILLLGLGNQALSSEFVKRFPLAYNMGFLCGSDGKESAYSAGDLGSIPELERSPGEGNGNPLQYSCLENAMGRGGLQFLGPKESDTTERPSLSLHLPATQIVAHKTVLCGSQLPPSQRDIFLSSQRGVCTSSEQHGSVTLLGRDWDGDSDLVHAPLKASTMHSLPLLTHAGLSNLTGVSFFNISFYLFSWLCQFLVVAHRIFGLHCGMQILSCGLGDLFPWLNPGDWTQPPCTWSTES